ncbi:predicted protein [Streptomyces viridosporus ATCC 14672]|uniref:Predicted protein n=1 Tax=Streptomyces viridosporus (strain ATCC 14672 / DSM 40746 / JCM 4963 / KCTC 9882 / NRRL B-12104 / FH 1290) TaxID=566461 RepID=D5ZR68_STRV1|nr:predicted protein [Streptomyces viridosporus ATCC 14672]
MHVSFYDVSFSYEPSGHRKPFLWVRSHSLYRALPTKGAPPQCLRPDLRTGRDPPAARLPARDGTMTR